ncbi:MAG TPA: cytochrome c3 family protein [Bacteroidia bacterium]|nr:cytochrome c3 family protein [Bacteroidia bacterium]
MDLHQNHSSQKNIATPVISKHFTSQNNSNLFNVLSNLCFMNFNKFIATILVVLSQLAFSQNADNGAKLFKQNCAVCHASHTDQKLTGPGLKGIFDRVPKPADEWLIKWILNNEKLIKSGDAYANKVYNENNKAAMTVFEGQLSENDVKDILAFLKAPPPAAKNAPVAQAASNQPTTTETKSSKGSNYLLIFLVIFVLAVLFISLRNVQIALRNVVNVKTGKPIYEPKPLKDEIYEWLVKNNRFVFVVSVILVFMGMKSCWDSLFKVGVYYDWKTQKGYKPEQPIKFSHKIHAGDNEIACQYCHNSVEKSRHSGIPTVNVCMNCHKGIQEGPNTGKTEIAKIYAAAGYDPSTGKYDPAKANPIRWIKVYNLPDHVYFSHQQHVVVGKLDCEKCHGNVKEMDVVEQKNPLTMKWCINCHRETEVQMAGNPYYDRLHAYLKEKYKGKRDVKFTVDKIGGLECGKCHY